MSQWNLIDDIKELINSLEVFSYEKLLEDGDLWSISHNFTVAQGGTVYLLF